MRVEFGPGGSELADVGEGDFIYIPVQLIHRESVAAEGAEASSCGSVASVRPSSTLKDRTRRVNGS